MNEWFCHCGKCGKILSDLGGKFDGELYKEILGVLGIRTGTTAAYSPFSIGIVEKHNGIIKTMMTKLRDDPPFKELNADTIMKRAMYAQNTFLN